jgi:hypothetical protein
MEVKKDILERPSQFLTRHDGLVVAAPGDVVEFDNRFRKFSANAVELVLHGILDSISIFRSDGLFIDHIVGTVVVDAFVDPVVHLQSACAVRTSVDAIHSEGTFIVQEVSETVNGLSIWIELGSEEVVDEMLRAFLGRDMFFEILIVSMSSAVHHHLLRYRVNSQLLDNNSWQRGANRPIVELCDEFQLTIAQIFRHLAVLSLLTVFFHDSFPLHDDVTEQ